MSSDAALDLIDEMIEQSGPWYFGTRDYPDGPWTDMHVRNGDDSTHYRCIAPGRWQCAKPRRYSHTWDGDPRPKFVSWVECREEDVPETLREWFEHGLDSPRARVPDSFREWFE